MEFEFDSKKSDLNKKKHGIGFDEAGALWDDPDLVESQVVSTNESRYLVVGKISGKHWSAVITYRGNRTRIIFVRRSRKKEVASYEGYKS